MSDASLKPTRILVSRTDRLGDVMMALPSLDFLRASLPGAEIDFLCRPEYTELLEPYLALRKITAIGWKPGESSILKALLAKGNYGAALLLHDDPSILWLVKRAGVPLRVGPYSKPVSFVLLNRGIRQSRSQGVKNEGEYNLDLAARLVRELKGESTAAMPPKVELPGDEKSRREARDVLDRIGVSEGSGFMVLHPGTGGSATNLGPERYLELMDVLSQRYSWPVVLTQGPSSLDRDAVEAICRARKGSKVLAGLRLPVLREVFRRAKLVIAPSTGPLHLAHYVGTRTLGLYAPIRSQRKERWAPWGGTGKSTVLAPEVACPGTRECIGARCEDYFCMERMTWGSLILPEGSDLTDFH